MGFPQKEADELLAQCHRRCCICHRFCGIKMELDHIIPKEQKGPDTIDNAIPLCFECHAEVHLYNDKHPRGRKYHPDELKKHKEQWLETCAKFPQLLVEMPSTADAGPLSALITELEYNNLAAKLYETLEGCRFESRQFDRVVSEGILSLVQEELRDELIAVYVRIKRAEGYLGALVAVTASRDAYAEARNRVQAAVLEAGKYIPQVLEKIRKFLASE